MNDLKVTFIILMFLSEKLTFKVSWPMRAEQHLFVSQSAQSNSLALKSKAFSIAQTSLSINFSSFEKNYHKSKQNVGSRC